MRVLVTGASGYIGSRLVPELLDQGHEVRVMSRSPEKFDARPWGDRVERVAGDVLAGPDALLDAVRDVDAAYYLIHSMGAGDEDFGERDERAAENFRKAAEAAGVGLIVYLGGLGDDDRPTELSRHLWSRQEVGRVLAAGNVPVTELRAAIVIGAGSSSFEMVRYLVELLPVMLTPSWAHTASQPIGVADALDALTDALGGPRRRHRIVEIGGPDVLSYAELMDVYAEVAGLPRRPHVHLPIITPRLSSLWVGLVTPVEATLARPLIDSLENEVVIRQNQDDIHMGDVGVREAIRRSVEAEVGDHPWGVQHGDPDYAGGIIFEDVTDERSPRDPEDVWAAVTDPDDDWRVISEQRPDRLVLRDGGRAPGRLTLVIELAPDGDGTRVRQTVRFEPKGLTGRAWWYVNRAAERVRSLAS